MKKIITLIVFILALTFSLPALAAGPSFKGRAHIENVGWVDLASDSNSHILMGTVGEAKRIEAFSLTSDDPNLGFNYQSHVQDFGWQNPVGSGQVSGTERQAKRIEASRITLTGPSASNYTLYYRMHVQDYGWLDWTSDFKTAGTTNHAFRCEAIEIVIYPKSQAAPGSTTTPAVEAVTRVESNHMFLVNKARKSRGLNYVTGDARLKAVCDLRVKEITQKFSHIRPNGESYETAVKSIFPNYKYPGGGILENIIFGPQNVSEAKRAFDIYNAYAQNMDVMLQDSARYMSWSGLVSGSMGYSVELFSGLDEIDFDR